MRRPTRILRRRRGADGQADVSTIIVLASLCALVFAGSFLLGRASGTGGTSAEAVLPAIATATARAPLRIGRAPAIATVTLSRPAAKVHAQPTVRTTATPAAAVVVSAPPVLAPAASRSPSTSTRGAPATSFDTSG